MEKWRIGELKNYLEIGALAAVHSPFHFTYSSMDLESGNPTTDSTEYE